MILTLQYWMDEDWFVGRLKGIPGAFSQGRTLIELEENIRDAYQRLLAEEEAAPPDAVEAEVQM